MRPSPILQKLRINPLLKSLIPGLNLRPVQRLPCTGPSDPQPFHPINSVHGQTEPVRLVPDRELQRRVDVALLLVPAHVHVAVARALVGQSVDQPGVGVEVEDDGGVVGEEGDPFCVGQAVGVVDGGDELEEVDDVDAADFEGGEVLQEEVDCSEGLVGRDVAARGHDYVGLGALVGREARPDADALCAVHDGVGHGEVLEVFLLVGDDDVDVVGRAKAVVHAGEEAVAVGGKIDAHDLGGLVGDDVEEAGVLVCEAVVVLAPDDGGQEDVEGGDLVAPFDFEALFEPFAVLGTLAGEYRELGLGRNTPGSPSSR